MQMYRLILNMRCGFHITHTDINVNFISILGGENRAEFSKSGNLVSSTV